MMQEEQTFLPSEQMEGIFSEPLNMDFSTQPSVKDLIKFQRKLIKRVRKHPQLYDAKHALFNDIASKEKIWRKIAENLNENVHKCMASWADIRCQYQNYVRRLRKYLLFKNTQRKRRPIMALETELLFLWRYIPQQCRAPSPFIKRQSKKTDDSNTINLDEDDDIVILDDDPVVIVLDDEEKTSSGGGGVSSKITSDLRKLFELVKTYPELYDHEHKYFNDYRRKGIIWNGIANEANDKATKLMKIWIQWQTRFEWELEKNLTPITDPSNDIRHLLDFMGPYMKKNPNTVYKQSLYLKKSWHEPIDHFKNIYSLIATLKKFPNVLRETELQISLPIKKYPYAKGWSDLSDYKSSSPGQFEATWLILRLFYWELMNMRKQSYQLQDKWYFENIITELYSSSGALQKPTPASNQQNDTLPSKSNLSLAEMLSAPSLSSPLPSITTTSMSVQPTTSALTTVATSMLPTMPSSASTVSPAPPVPTLAPISIPVNNISTTTVKLAGTNTAISVAANSVVTTPQINSRGQQMVLPKIVSAKSLAPSMSTANHVKNNNAPKGLQIMQVIPSNAMTVVPANTNLLSKKNDSNTKFLKLAPKSSATSTPKPLPTAKNSLPSQTTQQQQKVQSIEPPQLAGPFSIPKIASVHTLGQPVNHGNAVNQPAVNPPKTTASNFIPKLVPQSTQSQDKTMPSITPATYPLLVAPQKQQPQQQQPQQQQPQQQQQQPQISQNVLSSQPTPISNALPTVPKTQQAKITLKPVSQLMAQPPPVIQTLPGVPISNQSFPTFSITRTQTPPAINNGVVQVTTQYPAGAVLQSLNRNEIMIELIASANGNQLVVHGPPLAESLTMSMAKTAEFIRQVMALPLIHNKSYAQNSRVQAYWVYLSSLFSMPAHVCRAVWNFLSENFNHFSQIAPMEELMKPFQTNAKAWEISTTLFKKFETKVTQKGWLIYEQKLPGLMERIGKERILYQDLSKQCNVPIRMKNHYKVVEIWKKLRLEFNIDDIEEIWIAFKSVFWQYMHELEMGFENNWPLRLWRPLSKLHFLIRQRYHNQEPFYYIVRNKFQEEVDRCNELERRAKEANAALLLNAPNPPSSYDIDAYNLLAAVKRNSQIYIPSSTSERELAWRNVATELKTNVASCQATFKRALKNYRIFMHRDPANRCRLNHRYYKNLHAIYRALKNSQKISIRTPNELNQSVDDAADPNDVIFPERMIFDINMDTCSPTLVIKNWAYGLGNYSNAGTVQKQLPDKIHAIFAKYQNLSGGAFKL